LSAARAATVARLFSEHGVNADRLGIIGWGEMRPVADNASVEGRNRNRRVLVVVLSDRTAPSRFYTDADHIDETAETVSEPATAPAQMPTARVYATDASRAASTETPAGLPRVPVITAVAPSAPSHTVEATTAAGSGTPITDESSMARRSAPAPQIR
jgi:chemotaxis protein MotB